MATIFSHPAFIPPGNFSLVGYNMVKSAAYVNTTSGLSAVLAPGSATVTPGSMQGIQVGTILNCDASGNPESVVVSSVTPTAFTATFTLTHAAGFSITSNTFAPNYYGPWTPFLSSYTKNTDILDVNGNLWDLYRVQPIVLINGQQVTLEWSRPFHASTPLYDMQISMLLENFRRNYISDEPIPQTDSTVINESTGAGTMPFITDANTSRFYLAFLPNADPQKFIAEEALIYAGSSQAVATPLVPYSDYYPRSDGGYIDFKTNPALGSYMRVEYKSVRYTQDECRKMLLNAVSALSLYGINGFQIGNSNNLYSLQTPLMNNDLAEIVCQIAGKNLLASQVERSFEQSESWKKGNVEYTADPSRGIQAASLWVHNEDDEIRAKANAWIKNNRTYFSRGEFDSYFETSGILPVYTLFISTFNSFGWWM